MLTDAELKTAREILGELGEPVEIISINSDEFVRQICNLSEKITCSFLRRDGVPTVVIRRGDVEITYHAIPTGNEFEPFLKTVKMLSNVRCFENLSADIKVFIAPSCPHCARVVENVNRIAVKNPRVKVKIIDVSLLPDTIEKYGIKSAPTVIINDEIRLVGYVDEEEIRRLIKDKDKREYIRILLINGSVDDVKDLAYRDRNCLKTLAEYIAHREFPVRLGSMIVLDQIFKERPDLIKPLKCEIRKHLKSNDSRIKQDTAMLLGYIGDEEDIRFLEELLKENGDVRESAIEAIDLIRRRSKS